MMCRAISRRLALLACAVTPVVAACSRPPVVAAATNVLRDVAGPAPTRPDSAPPTAEDARVVGRLVQDYLRVRPAGRAPNPYWRRDEQQRFPWFDLAGVETYRQRYFRDRFGSYRVAVSVPAVGAEPGTLEAVIHFVPRAAPRDTQRHTPRGAFPDARGADARVHLFARRERGVWRLGSALPQRTRGWPETVVGRIRYRVQPGVALDSALASSGARFLDSLARAFGVALPDEVLYVLTRSGADGLQVIGIDDPRHRLGGLHLGPNRLVISAGGARDPYLRHELTHAALEGAGDPRLRQRLVVEGVAEWVGWREMPSREWGARARVRQVLARRRALTLAEVVRQRRNDGDGDADPDAEALVYPTGAWLVGRVHQVAGARGVRDLLEVREHDPDEFLAVARRHLGLSPRALEDAWRAWTHEAGNTVATP